MTDRVGAVAWISGEIESARTVLVLLLTHLEATNNTLRLFRAQPTSEELWITIVMSFAGEGNNHALLRFLSPTEKRQRSD